MMKTTTCLGKKLYICKIQFLQLMFHPSASADKHYCSTWSISTNPDQYWTKAVTIDDYSPLFALFVLFAIRLTIRCSLFAAIRGYSLFAIRDYSLFAIRVFQTPLTNYVPKQTKSKIGKYRYRIKIGRVRRSFVFYCYPHSTRQHSGFASIRRQ